MSSLSPLRSSVAIIALPNIGVGCVFCSHGLFSAFVFLSCNVHVPILCDLNCVLGRQDMEALHAYLRSAILAGGFTGSLPWDAIAALGLNKQAQMGFVHESCAQGDVRVLVRHTSG